VIYNLPLTKLDGGAAKSAAKSAAETVKMATATTTSTVGRTPGELPGGAGVSWPARLNIEHRAATHWSVSGPELGHCWSSGHWTTFAPVFISSSFPSVSSDYPDFSASGRRQSGPN